MKIQKDKWYVAKLMPYDGDVHLLGRHQDIEKLKKRTEFQHVLTPRVDPMEFDSPAEAKKVADEIKTQEPNAIQKKLYVAMTGKMVQYEMIRGKLAKGQEMTNPGYTKIEAMDYLSRIEKPPLTSESDLVIVTLEKDDVKRTKGGTFWMNKKTGVKLAKKADKR